MSTAVKTPVSVATEAKRAVLAEKLRQLAANRKPRALSFAQQRLWFLDQLEPNSPLYNIAILGRLEGELDLEALRKSLNFVFARHEILRTRFVNEDGTPQQVVLPEAKLELKAVALTEGTPPEREAEVGRLVREEVRKPFNLSGELLVRCTLLKVDERDHRLAVVFHHIVSDEWSLKIFFSELGTAYAAQVAGQTPSLPRLPLQYGDFAEWQREWLKGEVLEKQLAYWKQQLAAPPAPVEIPSDRPRPNTPTFAGATLTRTFAPQLSAGIRAVAQSRNATSFMVLLAAFKALLFRYTRQEDLVVGSPIAGRNRVETEPLIGFFVNTLPLRTRLAGNPSFEEVLGRVREGTLGAFAHQDLPFERMVHELHPERSLHHLPFARLMFVVQNAPLQELQWAGLKVRFEEYDSDLAKFDFTLVLQDGAQELTARVEYNTDLFEAATIERLLRHFEVLLQGAVSNPALKLSELPLLTPAERRQLLVEWNQTATEYPRTKSIPELFEAHAAAHPDAIAARFGEQTITYGELNARANQLARYLHQFGVGEDRPAAICVRRSTAMVVGLLGILKAGAPYVPLDPRFPRERLQFILEDTQAPVLLTEQGLLPNVPRDSARVICLDTDWELVGREQRDNLAVPLSGERLAYVMYTSGSTGQPKGVAVPHRGVVRLVTGTNYIALGPSDRLAQVSNFSFDAATFEIWGALLNGGQLVGISGDVALSPSDFARELREKGVTAMFLTSALFNQLAADVPGAFEGIGTVMAGGEALDPKWVRSVLENKPPGRVLNGYGPTENTTFTCYHHITSVPPQATNIPIGRPLANTSVFILDPELNPVPIGVPGELYTGGDGLARGYWRRPELTSEKFVANPLPETAATSPVLYRTGDLARFLPNGSIEFLGRIDTQVKLRGFRIELGEIETLLARHPAVRQAVVAIAGQNSNKRLVAYVVTVDGASPNASELRSFLGRSLPSYMLPGTFVGLPAIPVTANGKVDRRALPVPDQERPELERKYVPPSDEVELQLTRIWEEILKIRPIGIYDKFFDLGGHSLLAVKVISQIEKKFGRKLRLATIFQAPTILQLAGVLREEIKESAITRKTSVVEIQGNGSRPPLFLVHGAGGGMFWGYVNLSRHLGPDQPVYAFRSRGLDGRDEFDRIEKIASSYVADLRQAQPQGPYYLAGYCFGGNVAYEMARQLEQANQQVAFVGLLNCAPPNSRYTSIPWTPAWFLRFGQNLLYWANYCAHWSPTQRRDFVRWKWSLLKKRLGGLVGRQEQPGLGQVQAGDFVDLSSYTEEERKVWKAHIEALVAFHPKSLQGKVHLFRSPGHPLWCSFDPDYGWGDLAKGGVDITLVPGAHEKILEEPCVAALARKLSLALEGAQVPASAEATADPVVSSTSAGPEEVFPLETPYHRQFEAVAAKNPQGIAACCDGIELTYEELNRRANQLAAYLISRGAGPETLIGVCLDRCPELPVVLLGILKAGAAYLPLDPSYPKDRIQYMLADAKARLVVTRSAFREILGTSAGAEAVLTDDLAVVETIGRCSPENPGGSSSADNLAYVIYTSGSTGRPKGVMIPHRSLVNHNHGVWRAFGLLPSDRVLQFAPISFDVSVEEIFPTWLAGGTVVFRAPGQVSSPRSFLKEVAADGVTVLNLPTAFWHEMVEAMAATEPEFPPSIRLVVIGGEKASAEAFRRWKQRVPARVKLLNSYGVTEATITTTWYEAQPGDDDLPIGRPLANSTAVVLDEQLKPVPRGATGELFVGGAGLARGYLHRPELTAERFIRNPLPGSGPELLYRTGDLVSLRDDGNLVFLGRIDEQVKLRGYRIELGEIEAALREHPDLKDAAVVARESARGGKRLVAYYVVRNPVPVGQITGFLKQRLPPYMVPAAFVRLEMLPLTPGGKVDRRALPEPGSSRPDLAEEYVSPRTPLEEQLAQIWSDVLGIAQVGVLDNFFDLGGHSLLGIQMNSRIRDRLNLDLPLNELFAKPTIAGLAAHLSRTAQPLLSVIPGSGARPVPLTPAQRRVWFLDIFEPEQSPYNRPVALNLKGPLDLAALKLSLNCLARRQEALRATFPAEEGLPAQYILENADVILPVVDFSDLAPEQARREANKRIASEAALTHITLQPALRALLFRLGEQEHWLLLIVHELVADQRSLRVMVEELAALYGAAVERSPEKLPALPISYTQLAQTPPLTSEQRRTELEYWSETLRDAPALLAFPTDKPRPDHRPDAGARCEFQLSNSLVSRLERLAATCGASLFSALLGGYAALLSRYANAEEVVIGTIVPGSRPGAESTVANFENSVALRCDLSGAPAFGDLLKRLEKVVTGARGHCRVPFAELLESLHPERNPSYTPVFQVLLTLNDSPLPAQAAGGLELTPFEIDSGTSQLDLALLMTRDGGGISGVVEYSTSLFTEERIRRFIAHFMELLEQVANTPGVPVARVGFVTERELAQLAEWNSARLTVPEQTLPDWFAEQAARTPEAEALICGNTRLSYGELYARAFAIAEELKHHGVKAETLVAICLERSSEMVAAILGTLLAGAAYVPLDPVYPKDRLAFILGDASAAVLLTERKYLGLFPAGDAQVLCVDSISAPARGGSPSPGQYRAVARPQNLAYVIYTSGSTGQPKGVALEHRNAVAFIAWAKEVFSQEELSGVLAGTSICFDLSIFELFAPLLTGGKVILAENALALPDLPARNEVRLINTVPSAIRELLRVRGIPPSVKVVNLAGEPLPAQLADAIYAETGAEKVYDLYGPTETTTYSTFCLRRPGEPASIGRPLANEQVWLLDAQLQAVPIGVPGELFIGGVGVARGYLNRPELTAQRFIAHPFEPGQRLYRTGDLARWRESGTLEYLGRIDHQVKIRGFRIELGEIEQALKSIPGTREAVVIAREDRPGEKRLVAYLMSAEGTTPPAAAELRDRLKQRLPDYMLPAAFVSLPQLPLTPNGKIDRKALPAPEPHERVKTGCVAPRNAVEEQVTAIWREVLHVQQISVLDNFFNLGGHSLLAIQVVSRIRELFKVELPLFALFTAPTVAALSEGLAGGLWTADEKPALPLVKVPRETPLPASFVQERLWFLHELDPAKPAYNVPAALRLKGPLDVSALERALNRLVQRQEALRTTFCYEGDQLVQQISPSLTLKCEFTELPDSSPESVQDFLQRHANLPFDLGAGPLLRIAVAKAGAEDHVLSLVMHHTISDGWSLAVFFQEWAQLYEAECSAATAAALPELKIQYADFAAWQRACLSGAALDQEIAYWKQSLAGAPPRVAFPADHDAGEGVPGKAGRLLLTLPPTLSGQIVDLGHQQGTTPFMVLLGALGITLSKWATQSDLVLGTVVAGRHRREIEPLIGCFMNFLPLRLRVPAGDSCRDVLAACRQTVLNAQAHQECPFEKIVEAVNPQRRLNGNPLYNVALLFQNFPPEVFTVAGIQATRLPVSADAPLLDLRFEAEQSPAGLVISCEYRTDLFDKETIEHLLGSYAAMIEAVVSRPEARVQELGLGESLAKRAAASAEAPARKIVVAGTFTAEPLEEPLGYWLNELELDTALEFAPYNQVFQELLDPASVTGANAHGLNLLLIRLEDWHLPGPGGESAADHLKRNQGEFSAALRTAAARSAAPFLACFCPGSPAARDGGTAPCEIAETELLRDLAAIPNVYLLGSGELQRLYPVSTYFDQAAFELGHIPYTPVFFSALATAVTRKFHALNRKPFKVIALDCDNTLWGGVCGEDGARGVRLELPWRRLHEFMRAQLDSGMLLCLCSKNNEEDVWEVFRERPEMPLAREHFAAARLNWETKSANLRALAQELNLGLDSFIFIDDNPLECAEVGANCPEVVTLQLPADATKIPAFLEHCWVLDHLKVTSEDRQRLELYRQNKQREELRASTSNLQDFLTGLQLTTRIDPMSPAEVARVAQLTQRTNQFNTTTKRLTEADVQRLSRDAEFLSVAVSDRFGDYGLAGVLCCRRLGPALQADIFLLSCRVLGRGVEHRMLARLGQIAVERGAEWVEIEFRTSARNKPALEFLERTGSQFKQAVEGGFLFRFPAEFARSVRFEPPASDPTIASPERRAAQTAAGATDSTKVRYDQLALETQDTEAIHHRIENRQGPRGAKSQPYCGPRTRLEEDMVQLWQKLLRLERVGINDDFFELGGHSLLAVRMFSEIDKMTGRKLPLVTLFQAPTIATLAQALSQKESRGAGSLLVPVQPKGTRPPLFLVHGAGGDVLWGYANLAAHMPADQPIYGIKSRGQLGLEECPTVAEMAQCYVQAIRERQPQGPYYLGGYCFGGNVAYEMARQLRSAGEEVAMVLLLDSAPANAGYESVTWWRPGYAWRFSRNLAEWLRDFARLKGSDQRVFIARKLRAFGRKAWRKLNRRPDTGEVDIEEVIDPSHFPDQELKLWQIHLQAITRHVEQSYPGEVTLFRTRGQPLFSSLEDDFCWGRLAQGGVRVSIIPGSHEKVFMEPHVSELARLLAAALNESQRQTTGGVPLETTSQLAA